MLQLKSDVFRNVSSGTSPLLRTLSSGTMGSKYDVCDVPWQWVLSRHPL